MIQVKFQYPWGERYVNYDSWVAKRISYKKAYNGEYTEDFKDEKIVTTQEEYEDIVSRFEAKKETWSKLKESKFTQCNSHYIEKVSQYDKQIYYIQGFLSDKQ